MNKSYVYFFQTGASNCWCEIFTGLLPSAMWTSNIRVESFSAWLLEQGDMEQGPSQPMMDCDISKKQAFGFYKPLGFRTHLSFNRPNLF